MGQLKCAQPVNVPIYVLKKHRRCSESFKKVVIFSSSLSTGVFPRAQK
jgi:hypothetical protein